ncbi:hypothetical protein AAH978_10155 [Streptomyces sp. ZYX-F-203]
MRATGRHAVVIGMVGSLISDFGPTVRDLARAVHGWSGWGWAQFFLVLALDVAAFSWTPDGPVGRPAWVYPAMATALLLSLARVTGVVGTLVKDARWHRVYVPPLFSLGGVLLAVGSVAGMADAAAHGEVDVTGRTLIADADQVGDGHAMTVTVENDPPRSRLRLELLLLDASPDAGSCVPSTTYDAKLVGGGALTIEGVRSGQTFSLPLGGARGLVSVEAVLHSAPGCRLRVSVAAATLHD